MSDERKVELIIPGNPLGKQVAKVYPIRNREGRVLFHRGVTPKKTSSLMNFVKLAFATKYPGFVPLQGLLVLTATVFCPIPKGMPKALVELAEDEVLPQGRKPDLSNILKLVEDALEGLAFLNDSQICIYGEGTGKWYSRTPRMVIRIEEHHRPRA